MKDWWKKSIVYEIYVKSFQDSDGDGIGDLGGIIRRLDYLHELGVDVLWLTPIYESPGEDNGYDISDYCQIMKEYGTLDTFAELLEEAHKRDMRIIMDLVVNHTSDQHIWFQQSRSSKDNPYRDYYIWEDKKEDGSAPNNWTSSFLGPAWEYDGNTDQYYLHMFAAKQPDLNWDNEAVREDVYEMMTWWLDQGIDGFRMDVISLISKDRAALRKDSPIKGHTAAANGPRVHEYLQEMNEKVLSRYDIMTVGETPAVTVEEAVRYANSDQTELSMIFQFELMDVDGGESGKWNDTRYRLRDIKNVLGKWQKALHGQAWNSLFWNNHDQPRAASRFGDTSTEETWKKSAKMLATALYLLEGTPYLYQGEELGMTNMPFQSMEEFRDIESIQAYQTYVCDEKSIFHEDMMRYLRKSSRDNARTPMQWDASPHGGFTSGTPWIMANPNYTSVNAEAQLQDSDSIFRYYQKLLHYRKNSEVIGNGAYEELLPEHESVYAYKRTYGGKAVLVFCNFSNMEQAYDGSLEGGHDLVLGNCEGHTCGMLHPYEAAVFEGDL